MKKNTFSLIINISIVCFTIYAIIQYFSVGGSSNMMVYGWNCMRFFTNLSNIFVALAALFMIPFNIKNLKTGTNFFPKGIYLLKYMATISVTVTFLTVVFFLGPTSMLAAYNAGGSLNWSNYFKFFEEGAFFLHFFTPVISIISAVFLEKCNAKLTMKYALLGLIPTVLYSILYFYEVVIVGSANGGWVDFYGFTFGGRLELIPASAGGMYLATYLISLIELKIYKKQNE